MLETTRYIQNRDGNWYVGGSRVEVYQRIRLSAPAFRYGDVSRVARKGHESADS